MAKTVESKVSAVGFSQNAINLAGKLAKDETTQTDLRQYADSRELAQRGPLWIYTDLLRVLGKEGIIALPSVSEENDATTDANKGKSLNNPWKRKVTVKGKDETIDFYVPFVLEGMPAGKEIAEALEQIALAKDAETKSTAKAPFNKMSLQTLDSLEAKWKARKTAMVGVFKRAVMLRDQLALIKEELPAVKVQFVTDKDGALVPTTEPFIVRDADMEANPDGYRTMSVGKFLNLKPVDAKKAGGSIDDLFATIKRTPKPGETGYEEPENMGQLDDLTATYANVISDTGWLRQVYAFLDAEPEEDSDDFLLSLDKIRTNVDHILVKTKYKKRLDALIEGEKPAKTA